MTETAVLDEYATPRLLVTLPLRVLVLRAVRITATTTTGTGATAAIMIITAAVITIVRIIYT